MIPENEKPAPRVLLEIPVEFRRSYARQNAGAILQNISLTGAFLKVADQCGLVVNDKLNVKFSVSGRERKIVAKVVWKNASGCGVQFVPQNNRDIQIVDDLIYFVKTKKESSKVVLDSIFDKVS